MPEDPVACKRNWTAPTQHPGVCSQSALLNACSSLMINSVHLQYQSYWKISYKCVCVCVAQMKCDQHQLLSLHVANGNNKTPS